MPMDGIDAGDARGITNHGAQSACIGVTPRVVHRIMRYSDYRAALKHHTVLGLTDTTAAMDRLPGIAPERQSWR